MAKPLKLLLVDDEASFVKSLADFLTQCGYSVAVAFDGNQAIEQMKAHRPALILLDLKLPGPSGEELIRQAKTVNPNTKVIVLTAYHDEGERETSLRQAGVAGYLYKPLKSLTELEQMIEQTLHS